MNPSKHKPFFFLPFSFLISLLLTMKRLSLFICFVSLISFYASSERGGSNVLLKARIIETQNDFPASINSNIPPEDIFQGYYYRLIQFNNIPTKQEQRLIEATGIKFGEYIPYKAFYIAIPQGYILSQLSIYNPRTLIRLQPTDKISKELRYGNFEHARKKSGSVDLVFRFYKNISGDVIQQTLIAKGCAILERNAASQLLTIRIDENKWTELTDLPFLEYLQPVAPEPVPDDTKGRSLHRSNAINTDFAAGRHWDGTGVSIALADDGFVGPHIDFTGRITNLTSTPGAPHGDMTSGIAVGAGNLVPVYRGMATGAHLYVFDIGSYPQIVNAAQNLTNYGTVITSTSYSQGCNDYDTYSEDGDRIMHDLKVVQPVFSAGNNNGADCGYGAGTQWGNITGGYKQGKNVIACANLDALQVLDGTSSHGPAADGRIKPDISSNGKDQMSTDENNTYQVGGGTSAACPGIAGICAQLYQAYRTVTGNSNPEAPLIKACLLNSAEDIGNAGPDFKYGYGRVNSLRAVRTIEDGRYLSDSVSQGETNTHIINVPTGTTRVKVMVLWLDEPGSATAAIALVNDIDMTVTDPSSVVYNPLVLDPTPNATTLNLPAVQGLDTLNNMEQVVIDAPASGSFTVTVNGASIPLGPQKYYLVYEFWDNSITLTYPFGGEGFVPGEAELLRWDTYETTGNFTLEYSTDNGSSWNLISSFVSGSVRQYTWNVPALVSGQVFIRISRGAESDMNDVPFSIINLPSGITVSYSCPDTLQLSWNAVSGATAYEVSKLGSMYMDSIATVTSSPVLLAINSTVDTWFSVRAIAPNNGKGRRATAIHKLPGLINCSLAMDVGVDSIVSPILPVQFPCIPLTAIPVTVHIVNGGISALTNFDISYSLNGGPAVTETFSGSLAQAADTNYTFATPVDLSSLTNYTLLIEVVLSGDMNIYNDTLLGSGTVAVAAIAPLLETFQVGFPPPSWQSIDVDANSFYWKQSTTVTGSNGSPTLTAYSNNYSNQDRGTRDYLITQLVDLSAVAYPLLTFDLAYAPYSAQYNDSMTIEISTDCGANFNATGYSKDANALNTYGSYLASPFTPGNAAHWRNDSVDLIPYSGQSVILRFTNINDFGNNLYVDNVNISNNLSVGVNGTTSINSIGIYPNPSSGIFNINLVNIQGKRITIEVLDMKGRIVSSQQMNNSSKNLKTSFDLSRQPKGIYNLRVSTEEKNYHMKVTLM
jgi:hypothetical protein